MSNPWISIKEKRPAQGVRVLGWHKYRLTTLIVTKYNESRRGAGPYVWVYYEVDGSNRLEQNDISHWQPLPDAPGLKKLKRATRIKRAKHIEPSYPYKSPGFNDYQKP